MSTPTGANGASSHHTHTTSRLLPTAKLNPVDFAPFGEVIQNPTTHGNQPSLESVKANQGSATKWLDVTNLHDLYDLSESRKAARVVMNMFVCEPRELTEMDDGGGGRKMVFPVKILERHPFTAQSFIPLAADRNVRYLVIVAPTLPVPSESEESGLHCAYSSPDSGQKPSLAKDVESARSNPPSDGTGSTTRSDLTGSWTSPGRKGLGPPDLYNIKAFIAYGDQAVTYGPGTWHAPMVALGEKTIDFVVVQYSNGVPAEDCQEFEFESNGNGESLVVDVDEVAEVKAKL